jgi:hypothetical protein
VRGSLSVDESCDVGCVELLEFNGGAPTQGAVASLPGLAAASSPRSILGLPPVHHRAASPKLLRDHPHGLPVKVAPAPAGGTPDRSFVATRLLSIGMRQCQITSSMSRAGSNGPTTRIQSLL